MTVSPAIADPTISHINKLVINMELPVDKLYGDGISFFLLQYTAKKWLRK
jgi:hypothetical protein